MADDAEVLAAQEKEKMEKEARGMGWKPREEYRGKEEHWVDAPAFVEKGKQILPIMQRHNEQLVNQVRELSGRVEALASAHKAAEATIEALETSHADDVKAQVEKARADLKGELAVAYREGDHATAAELTDKLSRLNSANLEAGGEADPDLKNGKGKHEDPPARQQPHPEVKAWYERNPDFLSNPRKVALANIVAAELRAEGDKSFGAEFLDRVAEAVDKEMLGARGGGTSRVEGDRGGRGGAGGGGGGGEKSYADLPSDAKAACDKMAARLVGPNRAHKDITSWRKSYATQYFKE